MHRRLVNEAGDVSEDMEMGRHFHVPAENFCLRSDSTLPFWFHGGAECCILKRFLCAAIFRPATYSVTRIRSHAA